MSKVLCFSAVVAVAILSVFVVGGAAQNSTTAATCQSSTSLAINSTTDGKWFQMARYPQPTTTLNCVEFNLYTNSSNNWYMNLTSSTNSNALYLNTTSTSNVTLIDPTTGGFIVNNTINGQNLTEVTFKLLETDITGYAIVCGYNNKTNAAFGMILARDRTMNSTYLNNLEKNASVKYQNFGTSMFTITQSAKCYTNTAVQNVPVISAVMALVYALLKFTH